MHKTVRYWGNRDVAPWILNFGVGGGEWTGSCKRQYYSWGKDLI